MEYKTSLDKTAKWITLFVTVLFLGLSIFFIKNGYTSGQLIGFILVPSLLIIYGLAYGFHPSGFILEAGSMIIARPFINKSISYSEVTSIEPLDPDDIRNALRTFGVGGLFGYYGKFYNRKLGAMTWYLTRRDRLVLITTNNTKKIIISPDDPENFIRDFQQRASIIKNPAHNSHDHE